MSSPLNSNTIFSIALFLGFALASCSSGVKSNEKVITDSLEITEEQKTNKADNLILKELGLLKSVEDSGYPFFTLEIELTERGLTEYFSLNVEEVNTLDIQNLNKNVGKYVTFEYTSETTNALLDLRLNGKSLINEKEISSENLEKITGILSNAAAETIGDIPGVLFIKTEEGITENFDFFITPEIVKANGKLVVGYYDKRTQNTIKVLKVKM